MSSDKLTLRQRVLDQILSAHENGIKLFICGLVHNYSVLRMGEEGPYYGGNPAYEGGQYLAGKRILNESEVTHLVLPDTILLEGFTPEWRYDPSVDQVRQKELLLTQNCYSSPTLHELIPEVDELEILVRGCDVPLADRTSVKKEIGFLSHCSDGRNLFSFCQWLRKRRQLTEYDTDLLEMFLNDRRPRRDLTNPNHYYNFYKFFESIILQASPYLAGKLSWFNPIFSDAQRAFREYIQYRDSQIPGVLSEELCSERAVLLKIGNAHMDEDYAFLPGYLQREKVPYCYFFNYQPHTLGEIQRWEKIKPEVMQKREIRKGRKVRKSLL